MASPERNDNSSLMDFFLREANIKDLTPEYLKEAEELIKCYNVIVMKITSNICKIHKTQSRICSLWTVLDNKVDNCLTLSK